MVGKLSFSSGSANRSIWGGATKTTGVLTPVTVALDSATRDRIVLDAVGRYITWFYLSLDRNGAAGSLGDDHFLLAFLMEGVMKHHSKGDPAKVLSQADASALFGHAQSLLKERSGTDQLAEKMRSPATFKPRMADTMSLLFNGFTKTPHLRDIQPGFRANLLVDPSILKQLELEELDVTNPFLAFIFDGSKSDASAYAHSLAETWVELMASTGEETGPVNAARMEKINRKLTRGAVDAGAAMSGIASAQQGESTTPTGTANPDTGNTQKYGPAMDAGTMTFGTQSSHEGRLRIARFVTDLYKKDFVSTLYKGDQAYRQHDGYAMRYERKERVKLGAEQLARKFATVEDILLHEATEDPSLMQKDIFINFCRAYESPDPARKSDDREQRIGELRAVLDGMLAATDDIARQKPRQAIETIAQCYLDCEFLHPMPNGNFRLFGLLMVNFLLARAGLSMSVIGNPNLSDGSSREEVVQMILDGQAKMRTWCEAPRKQ